MKLVSVFLSLLVGCAALPTSGPSQKAIEQPFAPPPYRLFTMDAQHVHRLSMHKPPSLHAFFGNSTPIPAQKIGIGDILSISIFESAAGGLFSAPVGANVLNGAKSIVLPNQSVDRDGMVSIPYVGRVRANGRSLAQLAKATEEGLKTRAIEPQVVITLVQNASMTATVLGDATVGGKIPLNLRGERILDVIALAGGLKAPEHQVLVRLSRGAKTQTVPLTSLIHHPSENIFVRPHDTLLLIKEEQYFYAFGAVQKQGQFALEQAGLKLSDALGKAGGLNEAQSNLTAIYLFREELTKLLPDEKTSLAGEPVIYKIDLSDPQAWFFLTKIPLRAKDMLYVSTAQSVEWGKVLALMGTGLGTMRSGVGMRNGLLNP